ncbi:mechanosensitive ion channel family protein [Seohaeicola zhoushanensis]|uniref:Mechanosensitive ion channel protein n=1 Tax=Seohaeicola zhoushanensis TaxID=1569283 RepID=A0A8J3GTM5_9RHOB|nr:mechanosensitive ion channel domain-containing protein [Seohaeicola zhoushanensis]GHF35749.1 mechanosensitive ion channel protein [Seohaeicola zhoushanensis]
MDELIATKTISTLLGDFWSLFWTQVQLFLLPGWRQYQLGIILALVLAAWLLRLFFEPRLDLWARSREGWPKWRLRLLIQLRQRLGLFCYAVLAWIVYGVMQQATWPSRSYLIGVAAAIVTVWVLVGLLSRLVRNTTLRRIVAWGLWIYGTLFALGLDDDVGRILDEASVSVGDVTLSLLTLLKAAVLIALLLTVARLATQRAARALDRNEDISPSMAVLATKAVQVLVYGFVFLVSIRSLGVDLTGFAVLSGAIGVGIGFGLQKVVSNLVSGIIILLDKSIKPGDVISLGDTFGWIGSLGARYVSVVTRDGKEYLIPNEDLITSQVVNWSYSDAYVRLDLFFGTSYNDDPHKVRKVAVEAAETVGRVLSHPARPVCHIVGFGDSSVDFVLRFWIADPAGGLTNIKGQVYLALWDAFKANGFSIPFPQREVRVLEGSTLETRPRGADLPD